MNKQYVFSSVLAPYINKLLQMKLSMGYDTTTITHYLKEFDRFALGMGLTDPHITEQFIISWKNNRITDCERTLYIKMSVWAQLVKLMSRCGCSCFIPRLPRKPKENFTPYIYTNEQILEIFEKADASRLSNLSMNTSLIAMPALIRLLYSTGTRVSEALSIRNKDVHMDEHYIILRKTKNGSERILPVCESLEGVLRQYIRHRNAMPIKGISESSQLFFVKADGNAIGTRSVYAFFRKLLELAGIPYIGNHKGPRVHDLRHTAAVHAMVQMVQCGIELYNGLPVLAAMLGHKSLSSTEQYVRLTCAMYPDINKKMSQINASIFPNTNSYHDNNNN